METATVRPTGSGPSRGPVPDESTSLTIKAYFLVQAESLTDFSNLLESVQSMEGVTSAVRVIGPYDIVAEAQAVPEHSLDSIKGALSGVEGVIRVVTVSGAVVSPEFTGSPKAA